MSIMIIVGERVYDVKGSLGMRFVICGTKMEVPESGG
jgi:hypothetical protein